MSKLVYNDNKTKLLTASKKQFIHVSLLFLKDIFKSAKVKIL